MNNGYPLEIFSPVPMTFDFLYRHYFNFILRDLFRIFIFDNIPETINETFFKYTLFLYGKITFFRDDDGTLLALNGVPSGQPDVYYIPENMIVSNPRLIKSYDLKRNEECIVVYCSDIDKYNQLDIYGGLYTLICKTATMLADGDISISVAQKNKRLINVLAAEDQNTKNSIDAVIRKQYDGEPYAVVMKSLIDNVQSVPIVDKGTNQDLMQLIEAQQYILSHFYESLGLQTHDQMKKERLITAEVNDNDNIAKLNIDNMLASISEGLTKVNAKYGTNITVQLNPILIVSEAEKSEQQSDAELTEAEEPEQQSDAEPTEAEESEQQSDAELTEAEEPEQQSDAEPTEAEEPEQQSDAEPTEDEKPETEISISIVAEDESTVEVNIDAGDDSSDTDTDIQNMDGNSRNDTESIPDSVD